MLGIDLSQELEKDYSVCGADVAANAKSAVAEFYQADITDPKSIAAAIDKARPDFVIHCAARTDVDGCESDKNKAFAVNAEGARNVALASDEIGASLVFISTDFVFDGKLSRPYRETDTPDPLGVYGASKLRGEEYVREAIDRHFILRTSWLYGGHGKNFVDTIIAKGAEGKELRVVSDQVGSPTYTKDLAEAIHALLGKVCTNDERRIDHGIYHLSNSGSVSWCDYAKAILKLVGCATPVVPISSAELDRPARRPAMSVLDNSKFIAHAGYAMRGWQAALQDYIKEKGR